MVAYHPGGELGDWASRGIREPTALAVCMDVLIEAAGYLTMTSQGSSVSGGASNAPEAPFVDTPQARADVLGGVGAGEALNGVDNSRPVWINGYTFQGRSVEDVNFKERSFGPEAPEDRANSLTGEVPQRTANLLWIKSNTFYREVLDDCKEQKNAWRAKLDASEKRVGEVTNEIYNLIGFFSVFQGVILTAVTQVTQSTQSSQPPRPLCGKVWFPAVLSGLAALAAVTGIGLKFRDLYSLKIEIHSYNQLEWVAENRESRLVSEGERFLFRGVRERTVQVPVDTGHLLAKSLAVIAGLIVFTVVLIMSYVVIMCDKLVADWH